VAPSTTPAERAGQKKVEVNQASVSGVHRAQMRRCEAAPFTSCRSRTSTSVLDDYARSLARGDTRH
jgi:hypothetical protein